MHWLYSKKKFPGNYGPPIGLITLSSILLSFEGTDSFNFSTGSLFVILTTCCRGLENNCTGKISDKSTYQIVMLKGIFSGTGSIIISSVLGEKISAFSYAVMAMGLGFVAHGLSIFMYVRAQRNLGAAKTSAYNAFSPFTESILAVVVNGENLNAMYFISFGIMLAGTVFVVADTIIKHHAHEHTHVITHSHNGTVHTHVITHSHNHNHFSGSEEHIHRHEEYMNSEEHRLAHC